MELFSQLETWLGLITLTSLEIILGIDNVIFLSILVDRLPKEYQQKGRIFGLFFAMISRIGLLFSITWIMRLTKPIITLWHLNLSGRDIILLGGGIFLITKVILDVISTRRNSIEITEPTAKTNNYSKRFFWLTIIEIALMDLIFSLDSVITAVGLVEHISVMVIAIIIATFIMLVSAKTIGQIISNNIRLKYHALCFLFLVGSSLITESLGYEIPKEIIYSALIYATTVEFIINFVMPKTDTKETIS